MDNAKVTSISEVPPLPANELLINALKTMLQWAESGQLQGLHALADIGSGELQMILVNGPTDPRIYSFELRRMAESVAESFDYEYEG